VDSFHDGISDECEGVAFLRVTGPVEQILSILQDVQHRQLAMREERTNEPQKAKTRQRKENILTAFPPPQRHHFTEEETYT
jgi:hypothetical protein